jgi:hypothetical protein
MVWSLLALLACSAEEPEPVDVGDPPEELVLPDTTGIDFAAAYQDAIQLSKTVATGRVWSGLATSLERRNTGCPDLYAGAPDDASVDLETDAGGQSWFDVCATSGGVDWSGYTWWDSSVVTDGDATTPEGQTVDATRQLVGGGTVREGGTTLYEFDGDATDAISRTIAPEYDRWTWSSTVVGTLTGTDVFGTDTVAPGGWRTDLSIYATGGDAALYEPTGNIFLFDTKLQGRFDSMEMDLSFAGPGSVGPDDCDLEPRGWVGLRDENAYWYDVVFLPRYDDTPGDTATTGDYGTCDGCGHVYIRGLDVSGDLGEVCLDFSFVWNDTPVVPPETADFVLPLHSLEEP